MQQGQSGEVLFSFGLIADVQYADIDDAYNYDRTFLRRYRNAIVLLKRAVDYCLEKRPAIKFLLQLGDLIDGYNKRESISQRSLDTVLGILARLPCPILHLLGNHELYNFSRRELLDSPLCSAKLDVCRSAPDVMYYAYRAHERVAVVCLDNYEVSVLGYDADHELYERAARTLDKFNPNDNKNSTAGMRGSKKRFAQFNGGVTGAQLKWLRKNLQEAIESKTNVIVAGHGVICERNSDVLCLTWSCEEILATLHRHSACVLCYFAGHDHAGSDAIDERGIRHIALPAVVETDPSSDAFAVADVYPDRVIVTGVGRVPDYSIPLRYAL